MSTRSQSRFLRIFAKGNVDVRDSLLWSRVNGRIEWNGLNEVLRQPDNKVVISVGNRPAAGNWLLTNGSGKMYFVLTFYDTPIASSTGLSDVTLPRILKAGCNA